MRLRLFLMIGTMLYSTAAIAQDAEDEPIRPVDVAEKSATRAGKASTGKAADNDLSFNDKAGSGKREAGFLYFKTDTVPEASSAEDDESLAAFTPRAGAVEGFSTTGTPADSLLFTGFTPRHLATSLSFNYGDDSETDEEEGVNVSLSSRVSVQDTLPGQAVGGTYLGGGMLPYQAYDVGLNIGYQGFNLGATMRNEESPFLAGIRGYDVGLSYSWSSFSTSLLLGEYSRQRNLLNLGNNNSFYALEFGASYRLGRVFRVKGGFRYITFEDEMIANPLLRPNSQLFYLGTNVNF